jgi:hypothetical protein
MSSRAFWAWALPLPVSIPTNNSSGMRTHYSASRVYSVPAWQFSFTCFSLLLILQLFAQCLTPPHSLRLRVWLGSILTSPGAGHRMSAACSHPVKEGRKTPWKANHGGAGCVLMLEPAEKDLLYFTCSKPVFLEVLGGGWQRQSDVFSSGRL